MGGTIEISLNSWLIMIMFLEECKFKRKLSQFYKIMIVKQLQILNTYHYQARSKISR
jgi:hypothetical protein